MAAANDGNDPLDQLKDFLSENPNLLKMMYGEPNDGGGDGDGDDKYIGDDFIPAVPGKR